MRWKRYKKTDEHSYSFGAFPTIELLDQNPMLILEVLISSKYKDKEGLTRRLEVQDIPYRIDDIQIRRLSPKENTYVVGVFHKEAEEVRDYNHLVCDGISDMGNLGNICRTMIAFGLYDLVTIGNCCDFFDPRTVRASMGSIFHIRHSYFDSIEDYRTKYPYHELSLFMLDPTSVPLPEAEVPKRWSLVFGNEAAGLPPEYADYGRPVRIPQSPYVDSLNLTTAVAVGLYHYTNGCLPKKKKGACADD